MALTEITTESHNICKNRRTNKKAIAPGVINSPIANISPVADSVATTPSEIIVKSPRLEGVLGVHQRLDFVSKALLFY